MNAVCATSTSTGPDEQPVIGLVTDMFVQHSSHGSEQTSAMKLKRARVKGRTLALPVMTVIKQSDGQTRETISAAQPQLLSLCYGSFPCKAIRKRS